MAVLVPVIGVLLRVLDLVRIVHHRQPGAKHRSKTPKLMSQTTAHGDAHAFRGPRVSSPNAPERKDKTRGARLVLKAGAGNLRSPRPCARTCYFAIQPFKKPSASLTLWEREGDEKREEKKEKSKKLRRKAANIENQSPTSGRIQIQSPQLLQPRVPS